MRSRDCGTYHAQLTTIVFFPPGSRWNASESDAPGSGRPVRAGRCAVSDFAA